MARRKRNRVPQPAALPGISNARPQFLTSLDWTILAAFAVVALLAYSPALTGSFIWDDDAHVTRPELRSLTGLYRIWFDLGATQQYYPLLHSAFWLEHKLWGNAVLGYHVTNIVQHAIAAWLAYFALRR